MYSDDYSDSDDYFEWNRNMMSAHFVLKLFTYTLWVSYLTIFVLVNSCVLFEKSLVSNILAKFDIWIEFDPISFEFE